MHPASGNRIFVLCKLCRINKVLLFVENITCWLKSTIFIYVTKTTDFWGNIFTLVEGTGPATTML
jgi:hypothetical protein